LLMKIAHIKHNKNHQAYVTLVDTNRRSTMTKQNTALRFSLSCPKVTTMSQHDTHSVSSACWRTI
jgi:hypothetical protein